MWEKKDVQASTHNFTVVFTTLKKKTHTLERI